MAEVRQHRILRALRTTDPLDRLRFIALNFVPFFHDGVILDGKSRPTRQHLIRLGSSFTDANLRRRFWEWSGIMRSERFATEIQSQTQRRAPIVDGDRRQRLITIARTIIDPQTRRRFAENNGLQTRRATHEVPSYTGGSHQLVGVTTSDNFSGFPRIPRDIAPVIPPSVARTIDAQNRRRVTPATPPLVSSVLPSRPWQQYFRLRHHRRQSDDDEGGQASGGGEAVPQPLPLGQTGSIPSMDHQHAVPKTLEQKIQFIRDHPLFQRYTKQFERFRCPITLQIMHDPVIASDGHTYQRQAITQWLKKKRTSPLTNKYISTGITQNHFVRGIIDDKVQQIYRKLSLQPDDISSRTPSGRRLQKTRKLPSSPSTLPTPQRPIIGWVSSSPAQQAQQKQQQFRYF